MPLANTHSPRGFHLFRHAGQREPKRVQRHAKADRVSNLMIGDAYTILADGTIARALGTDAQVGIVNGIIEGITLNPIPASTNGPVSQDYIAAADAGDVIGIEDGEALFETLVDTVIWPDNIGDLYDLTNVDGDSVILRQSRQYLDGAGGGEQFKLMDIFDSPQQTIVASPGSTLEATVIVRLVQTL